VPLQLAAVLLRAVVLQYIGLTSIGAYGRLYREFRDAAGGQASSPVSARLGVP